MSEIRLQPSMYSLRRPLIQVLPPSKVLPESNGNTLVKDGIEWTDTSRFMRAAIPIRFEQAPISDWGMRWP